MSSKFSFIQDPTWICPNITDFEVLNSMQVFPNKGLYFNVLSCNSTARTTCATGMMASNLLDTIVIKYTFVD